MRHLAAVVILMATLAGCVDSDGNTSTSSDLPILAFSRPAENKTVALPFFVNGTATVDHGTVLLVQVKVDGGEWMNAQGSENWSFEIQDMPLGGHIIEARALADGDRWSAIVNSTVEIIVDYDSRLEAIGNSFMAAAGLAVEEANRGAELFEQGRKAQAAEHFNKAHLYSEGGLREIRNSSKGMEFNPNDLNLYEDSEKVLMNFSSANYDATLCAYEDEDACDRIQENYLDAYDELGRTWERWEKRIGEIGEP